MNDGTWPVDQIAPEDTEDELQSSATQKLPNTTSVDKVMPPWMK